MSQNDSIFGDSDAPPATDDLFEAKTDRGLNELMPADQPTAFGDESEPAALSGLSDTVDIRASRGSRSFAGDIVADSDLDAPSMDDAGISDFGVSGVDAGRSSADSKSHAALNAIYKRILKLKRALPSAESSKREEIVRELRKQVNLYFDADLKRRREELRNLEAKIRTMVNGLNRRERAKDKIVALQLQNFVFEAQGFGLFNASKPAEFSRRDDLLSN